MVNLFWLSPPRYLRGRLNYSWCARQHIDAHIIKIPLEAAQLLYGAHHALPTADDWRMQAPMAKTGERGYKPTHMNNPIALWLRESAVHYRHAAAYGLALCEEYRHRYGREHACEAHLHWLQTNEPAIPDNEGAGGVVRFKIERAPPCAMPDEFKVAPPEAAEAKEEAKAGDEEAATPGPDEASSGSTVGPRVGGHEEGEERTRDSEEEEAAERIMVVAERARERQKVGSATLVAETVRTEEVVAVKREVKNEDGESIVEVEVKNEESVTTVLNDDNGSSDEEADEDEDEAERAESLLLPIEDQVAASEVAFPLHVYQSYRAYYLGQKLSLKMSTFKTRDVPHWAQERLKEIQSMPPVKKEKTAKVTTTRTRRRSTTTTTTKTVKRKRVAKAGAEEEGNDDEEGDDAKDEDYTGRTTRSRSRASVGRQKKEEKEEKERQEEERKSKRAKKCKKMDTKEVTDATTDRKRKKAGSKKDPHEDDEVHLTKKQRSARAAPAKRGKGKERN